jgi:Glycosyl hydrolase catalytic core
MVSSLSSAATACCGLCPCDVPNKESPRKSTTLPAVGAALSPKRQTLSLPASQPRLPGKKGAAFIFRAAPGVPGSWTVNLPKLKLLRPSWNYNWGPKRLAEQPNEVEFVPMIWTGNNLAKMQQILSTDIEPHCRSGQVRFVLGFNEPDAAKQANMTVQVALERWSMLQEVVPDESVVLISPSCAHPSEEWMQSFMKGVQANGYRVDWVGVHWYGGASFPAFCAKMMEFHQLYQRPFSLPSLHPPTGAPRLCPRINCLRRPFSRLCSKPCHGWRPKIGSWDMLGSVLTLTAPRVPARRCLIRMVN